MPLQFDMPLDQLAGYQGSNPRPADFDAYWDSALAELAALDPQLELIPVDFDNAIADCFHLYFTGVGGARVYAKLLRPKSAPSPHPAVLMFHGYSGNSGDWFPKLGYVAQGYTVAALDCRGQGGRSEDVGRVQGNTLQGHIIRGLAGPAEKMLYRHIFLDTVQLARIVMAMPDVDEDRLGVLGGSQGGGLALACAALEPGIKRAASLFPFLCDYRRIWEIDLATDAYAELQQYFRRFDPLHEREAAIFEQLGYIDVQHLSPRIRAEVLLGTCLLDTVCPPSTQFAAYNKIQSPKSLLIYPDFAHEVPPDYEDQVFQFMAEL
ncbi:MAG: alpha/beta fold hydrolase [Chloroflexota bacterium]|jgi:cephalosporin-C deacetylase